MGYARKRARQNMRFDGAECFGTDQFGNQERVVDANESSPLTRIGQLARGGQIPELLQRLRAGLKPVP